LAAERGRRERWRQRVENAAAFDGWWRSYSDRSSPPEFIDSDAYAANALARIICRTDASRAAFIAHCYEEALAITEENKPVVLALARALIDDPERTLNAAEIDAVISQTLAREALATEQALRHRLLCDVRYRGNAENICS
jgi:hypothetical protein